jgi:hypothetical protein
MSIHAVGQLLTINARNFRRFDGLRILHSAELPGAPLSNLALSGATLEAKDLNMSHLRQGCEAGVRQIAHGASRGQA